MGGVRDIDNGYKDLVGRIYGLKAPTIEVGILGDEANTFEGASDVTALQVAIWNEFGTATIPERSFLRAWFDENQEKCRKACAAMMQAVVKGKYTKDQALELLAQRFVGEIQKRMATSIPPPNAASTVEKKGSDVTLINTGQMRSAVSYRVKP